MADELEIVPTMTKHPEDVVVAHRRAEAQNALFQSFIDRAQARSLELLAEHRGDDPPGAGDQRQARDIAAERSLIRATALRELGELTDADYPWSQWKTNLEDRLAGAEATYLRNAEIAEHPDAYGVNADQAELDRDAVACDILGLREVLEEVAAKIPPPNRKARRAAGQRGRAADTDAATD